VPASGKFTMISESPMRERADPSRSPCRSTILSSLPLRGHHRSQLNEYGGDVGARRGGGRKKDPQTGFADLDASKAAAFYVLC
jgi:hypothetical protein